MKKNEYILIAGLILLGVASRTILHLGTNVEFVTAIGISAGYYLKSNKLSILTVFIIMLITDLIIGNSNIFLFTWSAFLIAPLLSNSLRRYLDRLSDLSYFNRILYIQATGIVFTLFFYLWTNLGVVLIANYYPHNFAGILESYINGLPFMRPQLYSNLLIVPALFVAIDLYFSYYKHQLKVNKA